MILPMFPLGQVLLPTSGMPLHVFEPRYRQLVVDCLAGDSEPPELGTALIERGHEVGGGDVRASVGVLAHMLAVQALDDGRYAFVAAGVRRIRITGWLDDDPYPRAEVEEWPDPDAADPTLVARLDTARSRAGDVVRLMVESGVVAEATPLVSDDRPDAGLFQLAAQLPVGPADRLALLVAPSVRDRFDRFDAVLDDVAAMLRFGLT